MELDRTDRKILQQLQQDGSLSNLELAERIGLSPSPCARRVKALKDAGIIGRTVTLLNPKALGLSLTALIHISMDRHTPDRFETFEAEVATYPEVQECYLVSGNFDYLIKARVADMAAYRQFLGETLLTVPGVQESTSIVVMDAVKETLSIQI